MDLTVKRITNFIDRSRWLGEIMSSPYKAGVHWVRIKFVPSLKAEGKYGDYEFSFRGMDMPIVREIIHEKEYDFLKKEISKIKSPIILDIGAHIGLFSLCMLNIAPSAKILSVEAGPETFEILSDNVSRVQSKYDKSWRAIQRAAWKDSSKIKFNNTGMSMSQKVSDSGKVEVEGVSLYEIFDDIKEKKIDLMKVDIEGAEEAFLCANPELLKKVDRIVIELHTECCDTDRVMTLLKATYENVEYIENRNSNRPVLYCHN